MDERKGLLILFFAMKDLNEDWNILVEASRAGDDSGCFYENEERARQYDSSVAIWDDAAQRVSALNPDPSYSVLEIGPGPGVMTIPLARTVTSVTVVEPSPAMTDLLLHHLKEEKMVNVSVIQKKWEDLSSSELQSYHLVLASYSLSMTNIRDCLVKMCSHATEAVHLWWFEGITTWEKVRIDLFPVIRGIPTSPGPKSDLLMGILREMGYEPIHEKLEGTSFSYRFERYEDACRKMASILSLNASLPLPSPATRYIEENWMQPDGTFWYEDRTTYVHITVPVTRTRQ